MQAVKEIMTTEVITIQPSASVIEAIELMRANKIRDLVVSPGEDGEYGIVTEADVVYKVTAEGASASSKTVADIMSPCKTVDPELSVQELAEFFKKNRFHRTPVIQNGELKGIVSTFDIVRKTMWWQD